MKKMKTNRILALFLAIVLASLSACNGGSGENGSNGSESNDVLGDRNGDGKITISYSAIAYTLGMLPYTVYTNIEKACEERRWELIFLAAEGDLQKQGEQITQLIQQDPDYFILFPGDPVQAIDWVNEIADADIPCVALYADVDESVHDKCLAYCGVNNYDMACGIAQAVIEDFGTDAGVNIVIIGGVPYMTDFIEREAAYNEYFAANSNYNILGLEWAYSSRADAQTIMENFITAYGDKIDVLIGMDDDLTLGGINALQAAGMTDAAVYSNNGQNDGIAAVKEGTMTLTAFTPTAAAVSEVMKVLEDYMAGNAISNYFHYIETPHITEANADQFEGEF